jgi:hypothetical protein
MKTIGAATNAVYTNSSPTPSIMGIVCPFPFLPPRGVLLSPYPLSSFRSVLKKKFLLLPSSFCSPNYLLSSQTSRPSPPPVLPSA